MGNSEWPILSPTNRINASSRCSRIFLLSEEGLVHRFSELQEGGPLHPFCTVFAENMLLPRYRR